MSEPPADDARAARGPVEPAREAEALAALLALLEEPQTPAEALAAALDVLTPALGLEVLVLVGPDGEVARAGAAAQGPGIPDLPLPGSSGLCLRPSRAEVALDDRDRRLLDAAAAVLAVAVERDGRRRELESLRAEVDRSVHALAHDLRGPLISVQGMTRLLVDELGPLATPDARFAAERVAANVLRLERLALDVVDLARAGREPAPAEPVDAGECVRAAVAVLTTRPEGARLRLELPERWPVVEHDPERLGRAFLELLANAAIFTRDGEPEGVARLSWRVRRAPGGRDEVEFELADEGRGLAPEQLELALEPFWRADVARGGTGVGLAIAERHARAFGGRVRLELASGGGLVARLTARPG